jgi:hypothetical protein
MTEDGLPSAAATSQSFSDIEFQITAATQNVFGSEESAIRVSEQILFSNWLS